MIPKNICIICERYRGEQTCDVFPNGIPHAILVGEHDHHYPYPGDNDVTFEAVQEKLIEEES